MFRVRSGRAAFRYCGGDTWQELTWKGVISFGMVAIPMKLCIATESKDVGFIALHKMCNTRLRQKRWCPFQEQGA